MSNDLKNFLIGFLAVALCLVGVVGLVRAIAEDGECRRALTATSRWASRGALSPLPHPCQAPLSNLNVRFGIDPEGRA